MKNASSLTTSRVFMLWTGSNLKKYRKFKKIVDSSAIAEAQPSPGYPYPLYSPPANETSPIKW